MVEEVLPSKSADEARLRILEESSEEIYPGQRVKLDFVSGGQGGDAIADHLSVFYLLKGQWDVTFETLAYACRKLLRKSPHDKFHNSTSQLTMIKSMGAFKKLPI